MPCRSHLGCVVASTALSTLGAQTYRIDREQLLMTATRAYGAAAADELAPGPGRNVMTASGGGCDLSSTPAFAQ